MIIASIIFLAMMLAGIYFYFRQNRPEPGNRYHRNKPIARFELEEKNHADIFLNEDSLPKNNSDDALGLHSVEKKPDVSVQKSMNPQQPDCLVVLYLMASEESEYAGYELLQALLSAGMRFGKQRIFHRHEHKDGRGEILFHCASAVAPGTFDLAKMGSFSCKGLCLFFAASEVNEPLSTMDCLLETIDQLVEDLGGNVLDEKRAIFTKEKMVGLRQQLRAFETRKTTVDMFA